MIIECICGEKKFEVNSNLIPNTGRTIQCGACDKVWFFDPKKDNFLIKQETKITIPPKSKSNFKEIKKEPEIKNEINSENKIISKNFEITKYQAKSGVNLSKFLSYLLVTVISFIALIILIDTFKSILYDMFPTLETVLFSFFELLVDIKLFIKDLI